MNGRRNWTEDLTLGWSGAGRRHVPNTASCPVFFQARRAQITIRATPCLLGPPEVPSDRRFEFDHGIAAPRFYRKGVANVAEAAGGVVDN